MQLPILKGIFTGTDTDFKTSYPVNMIPVIQDTGISAGYLRPVSGITTLGTDTAPGVSRGAINWNGVHYRVMGSKLCSITEGGGITVLGDVGGTFDNVTLDYSFDRLAICSNGDLFYWNGATLVQVVDVDLGTSLDVVWVDGYFLSTDGEFIVSTELADPTDVNPLKYGSSEIDPDPIKALVKLRNEIYAVNRYTIEVFTNIGGALFPFQRIQGAQIQRGAIGTHCAIVYEDAIAFLGSGRSEAPGVFLGVNAGSHKISTREIDEILAGFTEEELSETVLETLNDKGHALLWVRLPDRTLVFDLLATKQAGEAVWHVMTSSIEGFDPYRARDVIWCYDKWQVADLITKNLGVLDNSISSHFGAEVRWEFGTKIIYNNAKGALFKSLELSTLSGRNQGFDDPYISTAYSLDGVTWSQEKFISVGKRGNRLKRLVWWRQGHMKNFRIQRFRGDSKAYLAISSLEADIEPLGV